MTDWKLRACQRTIPIHIHIQDSRFLQIPPCTYGFNRSPAEGTALHRRQSIMNSHESDNPSNTGQTVSCSKQQQWHQPVSATVVVVVVAQVSRHSTREQIRRRRPLVKNCASAPAPQKTRSRRILADFLFWFLFAFLCTSAYSDWGFFGLLSVAICYIRGRQQHTFYILIFYPSDSVYNTATTPEFKTTPRHKT